MDKTPAQQQAEGINNPAPFPGQAQMLNQTPLQPVPLRDVMEGKLSPEDFKALQLHRIRQLEEAVELNRIYRAEQGRKHEALQRNMQAAMQQAINIMNEPLHQTAADIRALAMKDDLKFHDDTGWEETPDPQPEFNFDRAVARIQRRDLIKLIANLAFRIVLVISLAVVALAVFV